MDRVSYFVVDNLHCPSCIFTVKSTLYDELAIPAANVHISLVSHTITVRHDKSLTAHAIAHALEKVGFDVEVQDDDDSPAIGTAAATNQSSSSSGWFTNPLTSRKRRRLHREICKSCQAEHEKAKSEKRSIVSRTSFSKSLRSLTSSGTAAPSSTAKPAVEMEPRPSVPTEVATELVVSGMTCASCANTIHEGLKAHRADGVLSSDIDVLGHSAKVIHDASRISPDKVAKLIDELGYEAQVVSTRPMSRRRPNEYPMEYRLEFHIGGMTCASCSNAVTNGLKDEPYIKSVNVNLMANSGTVILSNKDDAVKVKEAVESMGYTCDLGEIAPLRPPSENRDNDVRVVRIRVDGMFCEYDP
jgi:P-type Cu+ transporter